MSPYDARLLKLAAEAKVRPPHVFHVEQAIAADPAAFDPEAFAMFAQLEPKHVLAIVAALRAGGLYPERRARRSGPNKERATRLAADFQVPKTWKDWAAVQRGWTPDVVETVAAEFVDYWHSAPNGLKLDWQATWRNSVRGSRRPSGNYVSRSAAELSPEEQRAKLVEQAEFRARVGRA